MSARRIEELDFLKCSFILLMIIFHLVYFSETYPIAKQMVYTFHMPGFLVISGYVLNTSKPSRYFFQSIRRMLVPYAILEVAYVIMASVLPIREHIDELNAIVLFHKLLLHPLGPYWYLHTLMLCALSAYAVARFLEGYAPFVKTVVLGILLYGLSACSLLSFDNAIYFVAGVFIRMSHIDFRRVFPAMFLMFVPLILLLLFPSNYDRGTLGGVGITYCVICSLLVVMHLLPDMAIRVAGCVGRNTLLILLFSPIFTLISKYYQPFFNFDTMGFLFMIVTLCVAVTGSLFIGFLCDKLRISPLLFGKQHILVLD